MSLDGDTLASLQPQKHRVGVRRAIPIKAEEQIEIVFQFIACMIGAINSEGFSVFRIVILRF